jgi:hypothetical protein
MRAFLLALWVAVVIPGGMFGAGARNRDALLQAACDASTDSFWLAPRFRATVFQDSDATTPWAADGDPVGAVLDRGGRGYAFTQETATSRPLGVLDGAGLLCLRGDGVDDIMQAGDICDLHADSYFVVVVLQPPPADMTTGILIGKGTTSPSTTAYRPTRTTGGRLQSLYPATATLEWVSNITSDGTFTTDVELATFIVARAGGTNRIRRNGALVASDSFTPDDTFDRDVATQLKLFGNTTSNNNWKGDIREALVCIRPGAQIDLGEIEEIEARLASVHGVAL